MTKAEFKRRKDKLLVHRNVTIGRVRARDEDVLVELEQAFGTRDYKTLVEHLKQAHKNKQKELDDEFATEQADKTRLATIASTTPTEEATPSNLPDQSRKVPDEESDASPSAESKPRLRSDNKEHVRPRFLNETRKRTAVLRIWQREATDKIFNRIVDEKKPMTFLRSGTGTGKTYMIGDLLQQLHDSGWFAKKWPTFYPALIVTKASVVEQFRNDLIYKFGLREFDEFFVVNYEQLRSKYGARHIETEEIVDEDGEVKKLYRWTPCLNPHLIVWDEGHSLKNPQSSQHQIAMAVGKLPEDFRTIQVSMSATPWTRIEDGKHFACAAKMEV